MTTDFFDISQGARLLIVDHDADTNDLICGVLSEEGFDVKALDNGLLAWELLQHEEFELIVLDRKLPGVSGFDLCRKLRMQNNQSLILMTSGLNTEADRVMGLEVGADDYLIKPFGYREFLARCRALLRRHPLSGAAPISAKFECCDLKYMVLPPVVTITAVVVLSLLRLLLTQGVDSSGNNTVIPTAELGLETKCPPGIGSEVGPHQFS